MLPARHTPAERPSANALPTTSLSTQIVGETPNTGSNGEQDARANKSFGDLDVRDIDVDVLVKFFGPIWRATPRLDRAYEEGSSPFSTGLPLASSVRAKIQQDGEAISNIF